MLVRLLVPGLTLVVLGACSSGSKPSSAGSASSTADTTTTTETTVKANETRFAFRSVEGPHTIRFDAVCPSGKAPASVKFDYGGTATAMSKGANTFELVLPSPADLTAAATLDGILSEIGLSKDGLAPLKTRALVGEGC